MAGWLYIGLALFLGVSAINTGNNLIYLLLAVLLAVLATSGFFGKRNLTVVHVDLRISDEIYAGMPTPVSVVVKNHGRYFPAFLIRVHVGGTAVLFPYVRAGSREKRFVELVFPERGVQTLADIRVASVYPFSFFVRYRIVRTGVALTVFPHPVSFADVLRKDGYRQPRGDHSRERPGDDGDILSIRDYLAGDAIRYINWKASARSGVLKTNELTASLTEPVIVEFEKIMIAELELKLSCLTSLILEHIRKNRAIGLKLRGRYFPPAATQEHKLAMLRELAVYGREAADDPR